ncbi:MAG: hypothetical protein E6K82_02685 [Candidatus Rokuibacteriota bacterium]|nr:MAG: hypothetical protein E6K82_02685 [Candidatus Rokubacteria bacterium]
MMLAVACLVASAAAAVGRFIADGRGNLTDGVRTLVVGGAMLEAFFTATTPGVTIRGATRRQQ